MKPVLIFSLLAFSTFAWAQQSFLPPSGSSEKAQQSVSGQKTQAALSGPQKALQEGLFSLTTFLSQEPAPNGEQIKSFLDQHVAQYFDFTYMTRKAAGGWYSRLTPQQRAAMTAEMRAMFMGAMANRLLGYEHKKMRFMRVSWRGPNLANVPISVISKGSYPLRIDFRMYDDGGSWRVYDISANGQSAIMHYRRVLMRKFYQPAMRRPQANY